MMKLKSFFSVIQSSSRVVIFERIAFDDSDEDFSELFTGLVRCVPNELQNRYVKYAYPWGDYTLCICLN